MFPRNLSVRQRAQEAYFTKDSPLWGEAAHPQRGALCPTSSCLPWVVPPDFPWSYVMVQAILPLHLWGLYTSTLVCFFFFFTVFSGTAVALHTAGLLLSCPWWATFWVLEIAMEKISSSTLSRVNVYMLTSTASSTRCVTVYYIFKCLLARIGLRLFYCPQGGDIWRTWGGSIPTDPEYGPRHGANGHRGSL